MLVSASQRHRAWDVRSQNPSFSTNGCPKLSRRLARYHRTIALFQSPLAERSVTVSVIRPITWRVSAMKPALEAPESSLELVLRTSALPHNVSGHFLTDVPEGGHSAHVSILPPYLVVFLGGKT
jgi:hypothetical protein